jgi:hypothetical protein
MGAQTFDNFIGGSYTALTPNLAADTAINLYPESAEAGTGKNHAGLMGCPGVAAFTTLPTAPVRGILVGEGRLFVVAGAIYYEVFDDGTYNVRGDVGNDASNSPVQMFENGTQVMIVSAGYAYIDGGGPGGSSTVPVDWATAVGTANTSGTGVSWVSGNIFPSDAAGQTIVINGVSYTIASVTSSTALVLTSSAGTQSGVQFNGPGGAQPAWYQNGSGTVNTSGTAVTWVSGDTFDSSNVGNTFIIAGVYYTVASVTDSTHLILTTSAGSQSGAAYSSQYQVTASYGAYLDGFFIVSVPNTFRFQISAVLNGNSWNPLDFAEKEAYPDVIVSMLADHEQLWLFGDKTTEVWQNVGGALFPFQRIPGALVLMGAAAPYTPSSVAGTVAWLGGDQRGRLIAYAANGFVPVRISTHAVETAWWLGGAIADAVSFPYSDQGHDFWVVSLPSQNATWVYDFTEKLWHQRGWYDGTKVNRTLYATHGFVFDVHIVGDWQSGELYTLDTETYSDLGAPIYHERAAPHVSPVMLQLANPTGNSANSQFQNNNTFYHRFILDMEAGDGGGGVMGDGYVQAFSNVTRVVVKHNLGTTAVCIQVFDPTGLLTIPESTTIQDANTAILTFGSNYSGTVIVIEGSTKQPSYSQSWSTAVTSINITHGLGTVEVIVQVYDSTGLQIEPETLTVFTTNQVILTFAEAVAGSVVVIVGSYMTSWTNQTSVTVTHNLGTTAVEVAVYSAAGLLVNAEKTQVKTINTVLLTFGSDFTGYVVVWASVLQVAPFLILDWSDDGGHTFGIPHYASAGLPGAYATRVLWRRLGHSRDRVFRVRYLTAGKVAFINAYLESTAGSM